VSGFLRKAGRAVAGRLLPRIAYPVLAGPLRGARFVLGALAGEGGGASVYVNQLERHQTAALASALRPGHLFFDIGANVGYYTVLGSRLVGPSGSVVAFEPDLRNLVFLRRHLALNGCRNTSVVTAACSDAPGLASFSAGENCATGHLARDSARASGRAFSLVPTTRVDDVVERLGAAPDVVKIDVEGAELDVLHGAEAALKAKHPRLFLSVHSDELRSGCLGYLGKFGYRADPLVPDEIAPTEYLLS
jgi:FkbM family methyltransferase